MNRKIIFLIIIPCILTAGGFFCWWMDQADVRDLNKNLPEGVRVEKILFGDEYKVVNKIDGYEFKVPGEWSGIEEVEYVAEEINMGYVFASVELAGKEGNTTISVVNRFREQKPDLDLENWAKTNFDTFGLVGDFSKDKIGEFEVVKTQENVHLVGMYVYFFKKDKAIYTITNGSEDFIRYIITNGEW